MARGLARADAKLCHKKEEVGINAGDGNAGDGNAGDGNAGDGNAGDGKPHPVSQGLPDCDGAAMGPTPLQRP